MRYLLVYAQPQTNMYFPIIGGDNGAGYKSSIQNVFPGFEAGLRLFNFDNYCMSVECTSNSEVTGAAVVA